MPGGLRRGEETDRQQEHRSFRPPNVRPSAATRVRRSTWNRAFRVGAAAGCLALIPVMNRLGAVNGVLVVAVLHAVAALVFEGVSASYAGWRRTLPLLLLALLGLLALNVRHAWLDVRRAKGFDERGRVIVSSWSSFSRVTVPGTVGSPALFVTIDADAHTLLWHGGPAAPIPCATASCSREWRL